MKAFTMLSVVIGLFLVTGISAAETTILLDENFDSYQPGVLPSGWQQVWSGAGWEYQVVTSENYLSSPNSFKMKGRWGWGACVEYPFDPPPEVIYFESKILVTPGPEEQVTIGLWRRNEGSWGTAYCQLDFTHDSIMVSSNANGGPYLLGLASYQRNAWYHVKVKYNGIARTATIWVDGQVVGENIPVGTGGQGYNAVKLHNGWGGIVGYYDDIKVWTEGETPPQPDLVAYYPFNGNANDESGNGYNGTVNGATLCMDRLGHENSAYQFDGTSFITIPPDAINDLPQGTVIAWVRLDALDRQNCILDKTTTYVCNDFQLIVDSNNKLRCYINAVYGDPSYPPFHSTTPLNVGEWHQVAVTWDGTTDRYYLDGTENGQGSFVGRGEVPNTDRQPYIGKVENNSAFMEGAIDEIRIYNRALTESEINVIYVEEHQPPQEAAITGFVKTEGNGLPHAILYLARVDEVTPIKHATTDQSGQFVFPPVAPGNYKVYPIKFSYCFSPASIAINLDDFQGEIIQLDQFSGNQTDNEVDKLLLRSWEWFRENKIGTNGRVWSGAGACGEEPSHLGDENYTVSEAQAYGMLMSVFMNEQMTFDNIWWWTKTALRQYRSDNLFSWRWPSENDCHKGTASDADIDIATALLLATEKGKCGLWTSPETYKTEALGVIYDIWDKEVLNQVSVNGIPNPIYVLTAGDWAKRDYLIFDPSYFSPHAYKLFAKFDSGHDWLDLASDSYKLLALVSFFPFEGDDYGRLPPFWLEVGTDGTIIDTNKCDEPVGGQGWDYNYDSFRTYWRMAMDYFWWDSENAKNYIEASPFLREWWDNEETCFLLNQEIPIALRHNGECVDNLNLIIEDTYEYAGALANFLVHDLVSGTSLADDLFSKKISTSDDHWCDKVCGLPGVPCETDLSYYGNSWAWFATAMYSRNFELPLCEPFYVSEEVVGWISEMIEVLLGCPASLRITCPDGTIISSVDRFGTNHSYLRVPTDDSADSASYVIVFYPEPGFYHIEVVPDSGADLNSTFSLKVRREGTEYMLAENVRISAIPFGGYYFNTEPFASLSGFVISDSTNGLLGVNVDIYDSTGALRQSVVTDDSGYYHIDSIPNGNYSISVVTPLGYQAEQETKEFTIHHVPVSVDFNLTRLDITPQQRSMGYWKHQTNVLLSGKGNAQESLADVASYMSLISAHFNSNLANPITIFEAPQPATQTDSLEALQNLLTVSQGGTMNDRAKQHLIALMLNVVSLKLHQTTPISEDSASVSQAITYCHQLITDSDASNDEIAKDIADNINNGILVASGVIPLTTPEIAYKGEEDQAAPISHLPEEFSLEQNYPNPFNPDCEIRYSLREDAQVNLSIYNILGQKVKTLIDEYQAAGHITVRWDGTDQEGNKVASGLYFYRIKAGEFTHCKKMVILK